MRVYIIRHGYAGDYIGKEGGASQWQRDPADLARVLLADGIDAITSLGQWMADNDEVPSLILHSPVQRAKQSAKILARVTGAPKREEMTLEISKPLEMVVKKLAADPDAKRVALIAHTDNILPALRALNYLSGPDKFAVDPIAMGELRVLKVDRSTSMWTEKQRVLPSDLGQADYY